MGPGVVEEKLILQHFESSIPSICEWRGTYGQNYLLDTFLFCSRRSAKTNKQFRNVFSLHFDPDILGFLSIWTLLSSPLIISNDSSASGKANSLTYSYLMTKRFGGTLGPNFYLIAPRPITPKMIGWSVSL